MRTQPAFYRLKESLEAAEDKAAAWQIVNEGNNLNIILNHFTRFLPPQINNTFPGQLIFDRQTTHSLNLFEIYAVISLQRPELFKEVLKKFSRPNYAYKTFINQLFYYPHGSALPFEFAIILAQSNIAASILSAFSSSDVANISYIRNSLDECQKLYCNFNSQATGISLNIEISFDNLIKNLPHSYHSRLMRLAYMTNNPGLAHLYNHCSKPSFLRFTPQLASLSFNLIPLTHQDEETFLESIHHYFSLKATSKNPPQLLIDAAHFYFFNIKYQNSTLMPCMSRVYDSLITCPSSNNLLSFCAHYLSNNKKTKCSQDIDEQPPSKKSRTDNSNFIPGQ